MKSETGSSRRQEERVPTEIPVQVEGGLGVTRDISASGIFFEIDSSFTVGTEINFEIAIPNSPFGLIKMKCRGQIVRAEEHGALTGVAVKMIESQLTTN